MVFGDKKSFTDKLKVSKLDISFINMDEEEEYSMSRLENCTYRSLQQKAKLLSLPSNVKKLYLIQLIYAKMNMTDDAVNGIIQRVRLERLQSSRTAKKPNKKCRRLQGCEVTSSLCVSPRISATPRRAVRVRSPATRRALASCSPPRRSDRVLRSFNVKTFRPNYSFMNNNLFDIVKLQKAAGRVTVPGQRGELRMSRAVPEYHANAPPNFTVSRIIPSSIHSSTNTNFAFVKSIGFRRTDGKISKINALVRKPKSYDRKTLSYRNVEVTIQDIINSSFDSRFTSPEPEYVISDSFRPRALYYPNCRKSNDDVTKDTSGCKQYMSKYTQTYTNSNINMSKLNYKSYQRNVTVTNENRNETVQRNYVTAQYDENIYKNYQRNVAIVNENINETVPLNDVTVIENSYKNYQRNARVLNEKRNDKSLLRSNSTLQYDKSYQGNAVVVENLNETVPLTDVTLNENSYKNYQMNVRVLNEKRNETAQQSDTTQYDENYQLNVAVDNIESVNDITHNENSSRSYQQNVLNEKRKENAPRNDIIALYEGNVTKTYQRNVGNEKRTESLLRGNVTINNEASFSKPKPIESYGSNANHSDVSIGMSGLTDVMPSTVVCDVTRSRDFSGYCHKKTQSEQVTSNQRVREHCSLPRINEVFSRFIDYRDLTRPLYVQVPDDYFRSGGPACPGLERVYNLASTRALPAAHTHCVYSTTTAPTPLVQESTIGPDVCRAPSFTVSSEDPSPISAEVSQSATLPEMMEDALEIVSQDGDYMERLEMDVRMQCILCSWAGPKFILDFHIKKEHADQILRQSSIECIVSYQLGALVRVGWRSEVLELDLQRYVLTVKYEQDCLMAAFCTLSSELESRVGSITIYNKVTGLPYTWEGVIQELPTNVPYENDSYGLKIEIAKLDILPEHINLKMLNNQLMVTSSSNAMRTDLDDIHVIVFAKILN